MLTAMLGRLGSRILAGGVMVLALAGAPGSANAGSGAWVGACVGGWFGGVCAGHWAYAHGYYHHLRPTPEEEAEAAERERRWVAHCRPVTKQDQFGVPRYQYAAPGCEFGKFPD